VYGVVGSIVGLATVFTGGVTNAVQRFITFESGKTDGNTNLVFCTSLNVIFLLSVVVFILLESVGVYMLYYSVNIPANSMNAASWVLQLSILTCVVNLISIPYNALVIAHERMNAFAVISILQVVLTFCAVYTLSWFDNRLLVYGIMMATVSIIIRIFYQIYCHYKFDESRYHFIIDKEQLKQLGKFTGVSTASGAIQIVSSQGIIFVINWTFGVAINAVYNISLQLKNSILSFALNLFKAISPQITKTYANNEIETHRKIVYSGSKMEAYLIFFIMIPFLFRTEFIMHMWLGKVPSYAVEFAMCAVFISLTYALFEPIRTSVLATNKITKFMIVPEFFYLLVMPMGYFVSKIWGNPIMLIVVIVGMDILTSLIPQHFDLN
jgi:O-antigen/teichoic acid export membrane protein